VLLRGGDGGYRVKARFQNASQLKGNLVQVSGIAAGKVEDSEAADYTSGGGSAGGSR
jgi:ABC-type transporter Mla subunit MlaD